MKEISIGDAQQMLFDMFSKDSIGDRVYEFAQDLFFMYVFKIEAKTRIMDSDGNRCESCDGDGSAWYDDVEEDFFQEVYDKARAFLNSQE